MTDPELPTEAREFLSDHFPERVPVFDGTPAERDTVQSMVATVADSLHDNVGELGVALDFLIVAEELSQVDGWRSGFDPDITTDDIFDRYDTKDTKTLTVLYDGNQYGIRSVQNEIRDLFIYDLRRTNFPSSPGHHTGNWRDYSDLLEQAFRLSRSGRFEATVRLFEVGLEKLQEKRLESREPAFPTPFSAVVREYERSHPDENGGLAFQAIAYGYSKAEWSHLSFRASKVRTGSSRQNRYGDIDGFLGPDLMISVEVKDLLIDESNVDGELGTTIQLAEDTTTVPIAMCRELSDGARNHLRSRGVEPLDDGDLLSELRRWDYHKQNRAVQATLHYLANVEENPDAVQRFLQFIEEVDEDNRALDHLID
ncbi:hypothetical protein [Halobaculum sp. MBLA0143]|uniref:hypothetical protein n=1 Tax=Halobaculum sp. MBLA0143 TaxID=3079933 RepID=UPI003523561E